MSSFYASQGNGHHNNGNVSGNATSSGEQDNQSLPSYNNNYELRFQTLQYGSNNKSNGMSMTPSYSPATLSRPLDVNVFEVRFKCTKGDYLLTDSLRVKPGDFVKVEADRGYDIGIIFKKKVMTMGMEIPRKRILGHIGQEEMSILPHKISEETQAVAICRQMAFQRGLQITIADVEFQFDRNKLTVIFASEGRVDFRELVRDMFSFFRVRIWMQKVSPSEAMILMELAAADGARGRSANSQSDSSTGNSRSGSSSGSGSGGGGGGGSSYKSASPPLREGGASGRAVLERTLGRTGSGGSGGSGSASGMSSFSSADKDSPPQSSSLPGQLVTPPFQLPLARSTSTPPLHPSDLGQKHQQHHQHQHQHQQHHHQQQQLPPQGQGQRRAQSRSPPISQTDRPLLNPQSSDFVYKESQDIDIIGGRMNGKGNGQGSVHAHAHEYQKYSNYGDESYLTHSLASDRDHQYSYSSNSSSGSKNCSPSPSSSPPISDFAAVSLSSLSSSSAPSSLLQQTSAGANTPPAQSSSGYSSTTYFE